ncbi:integrase, catalytic region, zinc finger, CCHC-type containing protein [Tanacetum coccineum]
MFIRRLEMGMFKRILRTTANSKNASNVQCYNCNSKGHYVRDCPKPRVRDSKYFLEQMLLAKKDEAGILLSDEQNDFLLVDASEEVKERNVVLTKELEKYKEKVRDFETKKANKTDFHKEYVEFNKQEDKYIDDILNLEGKVKKNENVVVKMSNSIQAMHMLGSKHNSFYDLNLKNGLCYKNPCTLKKAISLSPKLYDASYLHNLKLHVDICDTKKILEDATKSQLKLKGKLDDPIAIEKKSMEGELCETLKQNELLNDRLLKATLIHDVEKCVLLHSECMNDNLNVKIEKVTSESKEVQENLLKRIKILENDFQSSILNKEIKHVKLEYQKLSDLIKKTRSQTQKEINELIESVNQKTYAYGDVRSQNQDLLITISKLKAKLNTAEKVHVANVNAENALKENVDVMCVSCDKIPCHDKCLAKYKLSVNSKVRRALFTTLKTTKSKFLYTTPVVAKTRPWTQPLSVRQFCDGDIEVAFRSKTCYVRNLEGEDLLTCAHDSNLYTIFISDMAASSPVCLMSKSYITNILLLALDEHFHSDISGTINKSHQTRLS